MLQDTTRFHIHFVWQNMQKVIKVLITNTNIFYCVLAQSLVSPGQIIPFYCLLGSYLLSSFCCFVCQYSFGDVICVYLPLYLRLRVAFPTEVWKLADKEKKKKTH